MGWLEELMESSMMDFVVSEKTIQKKESGSATLAQEGTGPLQGFLDTLWWFH